MRQSPFALAVTAACVTACSSGSSGSGSSRADTGSPGITPDAAAQERDVAGAPDAANEPAGDVASTGDVPETPADVASADTAAPEGPGADASITAFDARPVYFAGEDNQRVVDAQVELPATGTYSKITLTLTLSCPSGGCDPWDRRGSLGVVTAKGQDGAPDTVVEIARFITPYHVGMSDTLDVTALRPLLAGTVTFRAFIDTWVGPGSSYGDGWLLTARLEYTGGTPERVPRAVIPVFTDRSVVYGDPARPAEDQVPAAAITVPEGTTRVELITYITGHGQGNADNCAEFCARDHTLALDGTVFSQTIWRDDCATTAAPNQQGTWQYPRAGWCPGALVRPWIVDASAASAGRTQLNLGYSVQTTVNTCRPDSPSCTGCTLGTGCDYDGGAHTEPFHQVSTLLVAY